MEGSLAGEVALFLRELRLDLPEVFAERDPREEARRRFTDRARHYAAAMGVAFNRIFIKDQRTLWGSCSRQGNLNFNWRVVRAPAEVLDYLVVHELAHLREMNHSKRFWKVVESHCPGYREHRKWLRVNAQTLKRD